MKHIKVESVEDEMLTGMYVSIALFLPPAMTLLLLVDTGLGVETGARVAPSASGIIVGAMVGAWVIVVSPSKGRQK